MKPVLRAAAINMSIECVFEVHTHCAHCECLVFALYAHFTSQVCIGVRLHLGQVHIWWHLVNIGVAADVTCIWVHYVSPICRQIVNLSFYKLATDGSDIIDMLRLVSKQHTINLHGLTHCLMAGIGLGVKVKLGCLSSFMKGTI